MCMCLGLCSFITCADLCNYNHIQIENSPIAKIPLVTRRFIFFYPGLNSANHQISAPSLICYFKNLYKQSYTQNFGNRYFPPNIILVLRTIQVTACINSSFLFHGMRTSRSSPLKREKKNSMHIVHHFSSSCPQFFPPFFSLANSDCLSHSLKSLCHWMIMNDHF